jgi:hypothetical protein
VYAELDIEVFRHKIRRSQVLDKPRKAVQDRQMLTRARLIDNTDRVRLRKEKEAKRSKSKASKKGYEVASPSPSMDSTKEKEWDEDLEEEENDDKRVVSESESGGDSELEDMIVGRRRRLGNIEVFFGLLMSYDFSFGSINLVPSRIILNHLYMAACLF